MFFVESQVPSPTYNVFEEYVLLPAGDSASAMTATEPQGQSLEAFLALEISVKKHYQWNVTFGSWCCLTGMLLV